MFCFKCGAKVSDDSKFCDNCGTKLEKTNVIDSIKDKIPDDVKEKAKESVKKGVKKSKEVANKGVKKSKEVAHKVKDKIPDNVKENAKKAEESFSSSLPPILQQNKKVVYTVAIGLICLAFLGGIIFLFGRMRGGFSKNIRKVKSWQNAFLDDADVTLGETLDYALVGERWRETTYEGEPAVIVTGKYRDTNERMKAIFYVDDEKNDTIFAYYEVNGIEKDELDLPFTVTEYADDAQEYLGRD